VAVKDAPSLTNPDKNRIPVLELCVLLVFAEAAARALLSIDVHRPFDNLAFAILVANQLSLRKNQLNRLVLAIFPRKNKLGRTTISDGKTCLLPSRISFYVMMQLG